MKSLRPDRIKHAVHNVYQWALTAKTQATIHLIPLLALLEKGAGSGKPVVFEESDDFAFWDKYLRLNDGKPKHYFNPVRRTRAEDGYPHSNAATMRKGTFWKSWEAGSSEVVADKGTTWTLSPKYAEIVRDKALTKQDEIHRVPLLDLAVVLFRNEEFPDNATADTLLQQFRARFGQSETDFQTLFQFEPEPSDKLFQDGPPNVQEIENTILKEIIPENAPAPVQPAPPQTFGDDDPVWTQVRDLLALGTSGVILRGPPATGKSWYARNIAAKLVADQDADIFRVQFHPSYGYEDFVEGYSPDESKKSGFNIVPKKFLEACERCEHAAKYVVVIIDEINRGDPARVFGELLTYLESSYRGETFSLPFSGKPASIPANLLLIGTMNPYDRSVAQIDAAFVRRFDHITIDPSSEKVADFLDSKFQQPDIDHIVRWFETAQKLLQVGLGHTFFKDVSDLDTLKLVWEYRIRPTAEAILEFSPERRDDFFQSFAALIKRLEGVSEA
jgi:MoxR-like ATPase